MKNNELSPEIQQDLEEEASEKCIRPSFLKDFLGQDKMKKNLQIFLDSARKRNDVLDHVIFYGPPGLGKTTLSQIIAHELGVGIKSTSGPVISKSGDLAAILSNLSHGDVLFIDEIHRLSKNVEEVLYSAMEDYKLDIMIGEGVSARAIKIDIPKFTLVGATTRIGLISNPLRDRFGILTRMEFYSQEELRDIILRDAKILNINIEEGGAQEIAKRSRGTPRIAIRLLRRVRDFALDQDSIVVTKEIAQSSLSKLEIDSEGLDSSDIRYLKFIALNYSGGPVGIETISSAISEEKDTVEDAIEPYLIQKGFIEKTNRGRILTKTAFRHLGISVENDKND